MITDYFRRQFASWATGDPFSITDFYLACGSKDMSLDEVEDDFDVVLDERWDLNKYGTGYSSGYFYSGVGLYYQLYATGLSYYIILDSKESYYLEDGSLSLSFIGDEGGEYYFPKPGDFVALAISTDQNWLHDGTNYVYIQYSKLPSGVNVTGNRRINGGSMETLHTFTYSGDSVIETIGIGISDGEITFTYNDQTANTFVAPDMDNVYVHVLLYATQNDDVPGADFIINGFNADFEDSMRALENLFGEMWREDVVSAEVVENSFLTSLENSSARITFRVPLLRATGLWREIGLVDADQQYRLLDDCDRDTGWTTNAYNALLPTYTDVAQDSGAIVVSGQYPDRFEKETMLGGTGDFDNFDTFDADFWSLDTSGTGTSSMSVGRIWLEGPAHADTATVTATDAVDSSIDFEFSIDIKKNDVHNVFLEIAEGKRPSAIGKWYQIITTYSTGVVLARKNVGSGTESIGSTTPSGSPPESIEGTLRIQKTGTTLEFFFNNTSLGTAALASELQTNAYVSFGIAATTDKLGEAAFDNFRSTFNTPFTVSNAELQFHYKVYQQIATGMWGSLYMPETVKIGNDSSNYWEYEFNNLWALGFDDEATVGKGVNLPVVPDEWSWFSLPFASMSSTGSPTLNHFLKYFSLSYSGLIRNVSFIDALDFLRIFAHNDNAIVYNNFPLPISKGRAEIRQIEWNITAKRDS